MGVPLAGAKKLDQPKGLGDQTVQLQSTSGLQEEVSAGKP